MPRKNQPSAWERALPIVFAIRPELRPHVARVDFCAKYEIPWNLFYTTPEHNVFGMSIRGYDPLAAEDYEYAFAASMYRGALFAERILPHALADGMPWIAISENVFDDIDKRIPLPGVDKHSVEVNGSLLTDMLDDCVAQHPTGFTEVRQDANTLLELFVQHRRPLCRTDTERWELDATRHHRARVATCPEVLRNPFRRFFTAYPACEILGGRWKEDSLGRILDRMPRMYQTYVLLSGRPIALGNHRIAADPLRLTSQHLSFPIPLQRATDNTYHPVVPGDIAACMGFYIDRAPFMQDNPTFRSQTLDGAVRFWCHAMHSGTPGDITITDDDGDISVTVGIAFFHRVMADLSVLYNELFNYAAQA